MHKRSNNVAIPRQDCPRKGKAHSIQFLPREGLFGIVLLGW